MELQPGGYTIYCPAFLGCVSEGETKEEAIESFLDALEAWLAVKVELSEKQRSQRHVMCEVVEVTL